MPICLPIQKLAAPPKPPVQRFRSELLRRVANPELDQDVWYLRQLYSQIVREWASTRGDETLFQTVEPTIRELLLMLKSIADAAPDTQNAAHDFEIAASHASSKDYGMANTYLSYAMAKIYKQLNSLSNKKASTKLGYGYDVSGEVGERGGTNGQNRNLWDTGNSPKHDHSQSNPFNILFDAEAESDYPELAKFKHKRVHWPPRTR